MDEENLVRYVFTLELAGAGITVEEAWLDALEALALDPGAPPENFELDICPDPNDMSNANDHYKAKADVLGRAMAAVDNADNFITKAMMLEKKTLMGVSDDLKAIGDLADDLYKFIRDYRKAVEVLIS